MQCSTTSIIGVESSASFPGLRKGISAPDFRPMSAISTSSVLITTRVSRALARAASTLYTMSGFPARSRTFLRTMPFDPPRAGINARTVGFALAPLIEQEQYHSRYWPQHTNAMKLVIPIAALRCDIRIIRAAGPNLVRIIKFGAAFLPSNAKMSDELLFNFASNSLREVPAPSTGTSLWRCEKCAPAF